MKFRNEQEKKLWENATRAFLSEGQNEDLTKKVLASAEKEGDLDHVLSVDPTSQNKYAPVIAQYYIDGTPINSLKYIFDKMPDIEKKVGIVPQRTKKGVVWNKNSDDFGVKAGEPMDFIKFSEKVDAIDARLKQKSDLKQAGKGKPTNIKTSDGSDPNLVFDKNGIKIYEAYSQGACVTYSKGQSFCIGNPGSGQYSIYREDKSSSFHFVFDSNMPYPLQVVVVDKTDLGFELTDEMNETETIQNPNNIEDKSDRGAYNDAYFSYLKTKGVDMNIFKNNPYTEYEAEVNRIVTNAYSFNDFKEMILGKTMRMPNGDIVDLTLEWIMKPSSMSCNPFVVL